MFYLPFQVFKTLLDVDKGLEGSSRTDTFRTSLTPTQLSGPKSLRSDNSVECLSHQFSKLGPQENTFCCSHSPSFPDRPSTVTRSELPKSRRIEGSWDSRYSSFHVPCESDESQGYSQYLVPMCTAQTNTLAQRNMSQTCPEGKGHIKSAQSSSFSVVTPMPSRVTSGEQNLIPCVEKNPNLGWKEV